MHRSFVPPPPPPPLPMKAHFSARVVRGRGTDPLELVMLSNHVHPRANRKKRLAAEVHFARATERKKESVNRLLIQEVAVLHFVFGPNISQA